MILPSSYASFILRCWVNACGQFYGRLVDVRIGEEHPIADLSRLPAFIYELIKPVGADNKDEVDSE
jgi:hypothetical protein